jgi:hypothetical protein
MGKVFFSFAFTLKENLMTLEGKFSKESEELCSCMRLEISSKCSLINLFLEKFSSKFHKNFLILTDF